MTTWINYDCFRMKIMYTLIRYFTLSCKYILKERIDIYISYIYIYILPPKHLNYVIWFSTSNDFQVASINLYKLPWLEVSDVNDDLLSFISNIFLTYFLTLTKLCPFLQMTIQLYESFIFHNFHIQVIWKLFVGNSLPNFTEILVFCSAVLVVDCFALLVKCNVFLYGILLEKTRMVNEGALQYFYMNEHAIINY